MNQDNQYSKHDASTRRALGQLAPAERCGLDGRTPEIPVHLPCGHVYCKLCAQDIAVTAQLVGQVPVCKVCYEPFQVGLPTLEKVRGRNGKGSMGGFLFPDEDESVGLSDTIGAQARQTIINSGGSTLPWVPPSQRVLQLLEEYTSPAKRAAMPDLPVSPRHENAAQDTVWQQSMDDLGGSRTMDFGLPDGNPVGDMSFDEFFDFGDAGTDNDFLSFGGVGEHQIHAQNPFQFEAPLFGLTTADAPTLSQPAHQQLSVSVPQICSTKPPPSHAINLQTPKSLPALPQLAYFTPSSLTPLPFQRPSPLPLSVSQPVPSQSHPVQHNHATYSTQRDISILAGERFCFKGHLPNQATMEQAVRANGGLITNGGFKHTTYGVVGPGWKITASWKVNGIKVIDEVGFWEVLDEKRQAGEAEKTA